MDVGKIPLSASACDRRAAHERASAPSRRRRSEPTRPQAAALSLLPPTRPPLRNCPAWLEGWVGFARWRAP
eukprot:1868508-Prymnesium_polylepis.1